MTQGQHDGDLTWLEKHFDVARSTDQLKGRDRYADILVLGLVGEVGSVLAERKKARREQETYPLHRRRLIEELGDTLWYLLRIVDVFECGISVLERLGKPGAKKARDDLDDAAELGSAAGDLLRVIRKPVGAESIQPAMVRIVAALCNVGMGVDGGWSAISKFNCDKVLSRWPQNKAGGRVIEKTDFEEERFPHQLCVEFRQIKRGRKDVVVLRCRGLNLGDRLTDNINEPDYYRFHDVFHFSYGVYLGWSPVLRSLLKCKRKSRPEVDENEDGARAQIVEEAVSAYVFSHAKEMDYLDGINGLDYELLKAIHELVKGYEVEDVPLYRWEEAILAGYRVFRNLRQHKGGSVKLDFDSHALSYSSH